MTIKSSIVLVEKQHFYKIINYSKVIRTAAKQLSEYLFRLIKFETNLFRGKTFMAVGGSQTSI